MVATRRVDLAISLEETAVPISENELSVQLVDLVSLSIGPCSSLAAK